MFVGVADLAWKERKDFVDSWLARAQKAHDDDLLLTRGKLRPAAVPEPRVAPTNLTAEQRRRLDAPADAPDGQYATNQSCISSVVQVIQEAQLLPRDRAMPRVS